MKKSLPFLHPDAAMQQDTGAIVSELNQRARKISNLLWPHERLSDLRARIQKLKNKKEITCEDIISCWEIEENLNQKTDEGRDGVQRRVHFAHIVLYTQEVSIKLARNEHQKAASLVTYAAYHFGILDSYSRFLLRERARQSRGKKGGNGKSNKLNQISSELIRLLESPPAKGWGSEAEVVRVLLDPLGSFIREKGLQNIIPDVGDFILNALGKRGAPRDAYLKKRVHIKN
ncbi:hypothetical protein [Pseudomonas nitroreducens]|uniref:hypothetical protein n=1 Tax=Pseudomonas nitroreducens TaxID=46680 RepID=UPI00160EFF6F|nr:hypothetical protein [Pseudomonas nitritireducens]